eukprot:1126517-Rhodomonas_salina.2
MRRQSADAETCNLGTPSADLFSPDVPICRSCFPSDPVSVSDSYGDTEIAPLPALLVPKRVNRDWRYGPE